MCIEDFKLALQSQGNIKLVSVGTTATSLVSQSPHRVGLIISSDNAQDLWLSLGDQVAANAGLLLAVDSKPLELSLLHNGGIVQAPWWAASPGGATTIAVVEILLPDIRER